MSEPIRLFVAVMAVCLIAGCEKGAEHRAAPAMAASSSAATRADPDLEKVTVTSVGVDTKLAKICGLSESAVYFKFDSAKLAPDAKERLDKMAACAKDGAAKDNGFVVTGRTDPRGTDEYNKELGMSRADSVAKYLRDQGVEAARIEAQSKGEALAMTDPTGWPDERRVTVRLRQ